VVGRSGVVAEDQVLGAQPWHLEMEVPGDLEGQREEHACRWVEWPG